MKTKRVGVQMTCGECLHFKTTRQYETLCSALGVDEDANAPACFSPDTVQLAAISTDLIFGLGKLLRNATASQQRLLAHAVESAAELSEKTDFQFGQPVFFCLGAEVLSHYFKGYVTGLSHSGEHVIVSASLDNENRSSIQLFPSSILTKREYEEHKTWLIQNNKITLKANEAAKHGLPLANYYIPGASTRDQKTAFESYVPPTLEHAPASWFDKTAEVHDHTANKKLRKARKLVPTTNIADLGLEINVTDGTTEVNL